MLLLVCHGHPTFERHRDEHLGRLVQPRHTARIADTARAGVRWAADNDAFNGGIDSRQFIAMLDLIAPIPGCLFVTAPDVVGDRTATDMLWKDWAHLIKGRGLPVAYVLQDGHQGPPPWDDLDALFLGGTNALKLGWFAAHCVKQAKAQGKWVHMGRVNSQKRILYAKAIGCDSVDGTQFSMYPDRWIPAGLDWIDGRTNDPFWQMSLI